MHNAKNDKNANWRKVAMGGGKSAVGSGEQRRINCQFAVPTRGSVHCRFARSRERVRLGVMRKEEEAERIRIDEEEKAKFLESSFDE